MQQPSFVSSHVQWSHRLILQICFLSRTQQQEKLHSQMASHRHCRSSHSIESSEQQLMRKPPPHFSNESLHDTASRISSLGDAKEPFAVDCPGNVVISVLDIDHTPSTRGCRHCLIGETRSPQQA